MNVRLSWLSCTLLLAGCATSATSPAAPPAGLQDAAATQQAAPAEKAEEPAAEEGHGFFHGVLWYIPNRISDVLDIVRARVRVGPGLQIGVRATELLDLNIGAYGAVFIGLPGPRREREFNWPFGVESMAGMEISVADGMATPDDAPHYGVVEVGLGAQALIVGFDLGVDVWEIVDFALGIVTIDPVGDDV